MSLHNLHSGASTLHIEDIGDISLEFDCNLKWGTYGVPEDGDTSKVGTGPLRWVFLSDCDTEHLQNILLNRRSFPDHYDWSIRMILDDRGELHQKQNTTE